jgi:signal transduction histidine kinase
LATSVATDALAVLDRFFHRFPYGVVGLSRDGRVQFANVGARQVLGDSEIVVGRPLAETTLAAFSNRVLRSPDEPHAERLELPGGRVLKASGLGPRGAEPAMLILEDVTAQERQDRVTREFVRNAAHQLRTPLTAIATAVEVLQAGAKNDPAERDRFLDHVETHSERLIRIARGLLVLARAQTGEPMPLEVVAIRPMLDELAAEAQPRPDVELSVECERDLTALAVQDLTHEALAALVENAIDHTKAGAIRLSAYAHDRTVAISVTNTGAGMPSEHRERIFEPFYRVNAEGSGFGLGLAIAAQAVREMDGELTVDDVQDGVRFTIRLAAAEGGGR